MRKLPPLNTAIVLYVVNAVIAMAVSWGFHLSAHTTGAIDTVVAGVITLITLFAVRPVELPLVIGALTTVTLALSAFGLHIPANTVGATAAVVSILLGVILHWFGIPTAAAVQGKTGTQLLLDRNRPGTAPQQQQAGFPG